MVKKIGPEYQYCIKEYIINNECDLKSNKLQHIPTRMLREKHGPESINEKYKWKTRPKWRAPNKD